MESKEIALQVSNLSKQYRLGEIGTGTISKDINRWFAKLRGKQDPYLKLGDTNDRSKSGGEFVWALKDLNFEIGKGEIIGIIGKNGAGKSTLLKLLSRVTGPTIGTIKAKGRIGALLEVGTGFHPEMTGRENIYMNGTIMGMSRKEINSKLDDIIEFSGVAKYIDTPVKRYSSGMTVRLGFAIAAHLEPEILIVDEVLAVGDAEFRKKAIGKMQDVSQTGGRTVLFVSHNMGSIESLCEKCILMENGQIKNIGPSKAIIEEYLEGGRNLKYDNVNFQRTVNLSNCIFKLLGISFFQNNAKLSGSSFYNGYPLEIKLNISSSDDIPTFQMAINFFDDKMNLLLVSYKNEQKILGEVLSSGHHIVTIILPKDFFVGGKVYFFQPLLSITGKHLVSDIFIQLDVNENGYFNRLLLHESHRGNLTLPLIWDIENI